MQRNRVVRVVIVLTLLIIAAPVIAAADEGSDAANLPPADRPLQASALRISADSLAMLLQQSPEYESALGRKSSGRKKMYAGIAGMGAGVLIGTLAGKSCLNSADLNCSGELNAMLIGGLVSAGGGGVFLWGLIEWMDANSDVNRLGPQSNSRTATIPLGNAQSLQLAFGNRTTAAYRVRW
jgi:hypothetical protein